MKILALLLLFSPPALAADCGSNNAAAITTSIRAWSQLRQKLQNATGGFGFSLESATEGGTGDYAQFISNERKSNKFSISMEFRACEISESELSANFDRYYAEVTYLGKTFAGVGEGNLIQFPTCPGRLGANGARRTVLDLLNKIYSTESDAQQFLKVFPANPSAWNTLYQPQVAGYQLPDCAEWIGPSITALWFAAHALTIVNMQGMARFPDWNKNQQVLDTARIIRSQLFNSFRTMVFKVNQGQQTCDPSQ